MQVLNTNQPLKAVGLSKMSPVMGKEAEGKQETVSGHKDPGMRENFLKLREALAQTE